MRVGLLADTHDRLPAAAALVRQMTDAGIGLVMHAGDYCSPFSLRPLHEAQVAVLGVFGRNDGDHEGLKAYASSGVATELYDSPHSFEVGGHRILLVHDLGEIAHRSVEAHEFVIHGHSHKQETRSRGDALLVNPGEACGWLYGTPGAAILDLDTKRIDFLTLSGQEWSL